MKQIRPEYEFPIEGRAWTRGALPSAGVYYLAGDCHVVARGGPAALELEERGALLVALVRFDGGSDEAAAPSHPIRPLGLREAVARFAPPEPAQGARPAARSRPGPPLDERRRHADP